MRFFAVMLLLIISSEINGQTDTSYIDFSAYVQLDSIMITAKKEGFSVEDFIKIVQDDNSLEIAFNNLRKLSYIFSNDIKFYNNRGVVKASYSNHNSTIMDGNCQIMGYHTDTVVTGDYYNRSGNYNYYTSSLYNRVFLTPPPCSDPLATTAAKSDQKVSRSSRVLQKRIDELKKLIYSPGREAAIPLIGRKTAIFSEKMIEHYDFSITSQKQASGEEAYVFKSSIKPSYNRKYPNGSVVKFLEIVMKKDSYQVLSRKYKLQYNAGIYNFDVLMLVTLGQHENLYVPVDIQYDGFWKVVGKKKEKCKFHFKINEFSTN